LPPFNKETLPQPSPPLSKALFCYEGYKAYQPLNVYRAEQELLVHAEFRDGNVPAGYDLLRVFRETARGNREGTSPGRGLLSSCDTGDNARFGKIEFAVSCPVMEAFKKEAPGNGRSSTVGYVPSERKGTSTAISRSVKP
jgi:hypothetical protein